MRKFYVYMMVVIGYFVACIMGLMFVPGAYILDQVYGNRYSIGTACKAVGTRMRDLWTEMVDMAEELI